MTVASAVGQVQENSPAQQAGLEPYFDFIITIGHSRLVRLHDPVSAVHILAWGRPPNQGSVLLVVPLLQLLPSVEALESVYCPHRIRRTTR